MSRYEIKITFLPDPNTGKKAQLKSMKLRTRLTTELRAFEIGKREAEKEWPHYRMQVSTWVSR